MCIQILQGLRKYDNILRLRAYLKHAWSKIAIPWKILLCWRILYKLWNSLHTDKLILWPADQWTIYELADMEYVVGSLESTWQSKMLSMLCMKFGLANTCVAFWEVSQPTYLIYLSFSNVNRWLSYTNKIIKVYITRKCISLSTENEFPNLFLWKHENENPNIFIRLQMQQTNMRIYSGGKKYEPIFEYIQILNYLVNNKEYEYI